MTTWSARFTTNIIRLLFCVLNLSSTHAQTQINTEWIDDPTSNVWDEQFHNGMSSASVAGYHGAYKGNSDSSCANYDLEQVTLTKTFTCSEKYTIIQARINHCDTENTDYFELRINSSPKISINGNEFNAQNYDTVLNAANCGTSWYYQDITYTMVEISTFQMQLYIETNCDNDFWAINNIKLYCLNDSDFIETPLNTHSTWTDDFVFGNPMFFGWLGNTKILTNSELQFHGMYLQQHASFRRYFKCERWSNVEIQYKFYSCMTNDHANVAIYLDDEEFDYSDTDDYAANSYDNILNNALDQGYFCSNFWKQSTITVGTSKKFEIHANEIFTVTFNVSSLHNNDPIAIGDIEIDCVFIPTYDPTSDPTTDPTINPTIAPSISPSIIPTQPPSISPSFVPTQTPSLSPSTAPTQPPSISPTNLPSISPSNAPSENPSLTPSNSPTQPPSISPTSPPTISPSISPTSPPSITPTLNPSITPSLTPTTPPSLSPSFTPTTSPSNIPSISPSLSPSLNPSSIPSLTPSISPSLTPTISPSISPSLTPTSPPSLAPSLNPSIAPSLSPSLIPSLAPSLSPTIAPSISPSISPTISPTISPSLTPSNTPSQPPSIAPSISPSNIPSLSPSISPSLSPSLNPSLTPSIAPSIVPSLAPTLAPSIAPSVAPTTAPTVIGTQTEVEILLYYNMSLSLTNIILTIFNSKLSYATFLGIKYGTYGHDYEKYKFLFKAYTCVAFTVSSFDPKNDPQWEHDLFDCDSHKKALQKTKKEKEYIPAQFGAQYLGIIKIIMTANDEEDSNIKVEELTKLLSGTIENNENTNNDISRRRLQETNEFVKYTQDCMNQENELEDELNTAGDKETCTGFLGLDLEDFKIIKLNTALVTDPIDPLPKSLIAKIIVSLLRYVIYAFIGLCALAAILGKLHARREKRDNVRAFGIFFFSLYTWDFYSDIMFVVRLAEYCVNRENNWQIVWWLFCASAVFIIIPWILNLLQLFKGQKKWTTDKTVQEGVQAWFVDWSIVLVVAVALSGSSFGAIELANSNLFGYDLFCMGLSQRHLKVFQGKRFFSSVLFENAPQLVSQIYFLTLLDGFDEATVVALLSSSVSVILSVVDIWSARRLVAVMKKQEKHGYTSIDIEFRIDTYNQAHDEIKHFKRTFLGKPNALRKAIAQTLVINKRSIEIYMLIAANPGIKIGFSCYAVSDMNVDNMMNKLRKEIKKLSLLVSIYWKMKTYPNISNIKKSHSKPIYHTEIYENVANFSPKSPISANNIKFSINDIVAVDGETYSIASHDTNMNDNNNNNIKPRQRGLSKSSTYSQVAAQKLISVYRIDSNIKNAIKLADPQFSNELKLNTIINTNEEKETKEEEENNNYMELWNDFMRLRENSCSKIKNNNNNKHVRFATDENNIDEPPIEIKYNELNNGHINSTQWNKYIKNIEKLISSLHDKKQEENNNNNKESDLKSKWLLGMENINILLNTKSELNKNILLNEIYGNIGKSITEYDSEYKNEYGNMNTEMMRVPSDTSEKEIISMINEMTTVQSYDDNIDKIKIQIDNDNDELDEYDPYNMSYRL